MAATTPVTQFVPLVPKEGMSWAYRPVGISASFQQALSIARACCMPGTITSRCPSDLSTDIEGYAPLPTAIANCNSITMMQSARLAHEQGYIEPVLVGDIASIERNAHALAWDLNGLRRIPARDDVEAAGISVALARQREVASIMKGDLPTQTLLRAVLSRKDGIRNGSLLSHVFHMSTPKQQNALCVTDAVINVLPSLAEKVDIARNAVWLLHALGNSRPRIAVLSGTEKATTSMPSSIDAANLTRLAQRGEIPGAIVDGPVAFDIAVSAQAAASKGYKSSVSGQADILLVPNLEAGNILFKAMVHFLGATAAGIVLGAQVPIMLTSRSDPPQARMASAALAARYCQFGAGPDAVPVPG
jgi:phosphotransacetylase